MFFRLRDNVEVVEIFVSLPVFHPDLMATIIEYKESDANTITHGMKWNGIGFDPEFTQAELDAKAAATLQKTEDIEDEDNMKMIPALVTLMTARPTQIDNYIDNNVTDLNSAKDVLKHLAKAVSLLLRDRFR